MKVLQSRGYVASYHWGRNIEEVSRAVLDLGPVVLGTNWHQIMSTPNFKGRIKVGGRVVGGHAYLLIGVNLRTGVGTICNSWGMKWGKDGLATITLTDLDYLIQSRGEAALALEVKR